MFSESESIVAQKRNPPHWLIRSTPFRGLDLLLEGWPSIRSAVPDAALQVFSSMRVYQNSPEQDESAYGALYRVVPGTGRGRVLRLDSAALTLRVKLRETTMLGYPNTFPETSCIAVMEAMASGCRIVTSDLGALPETTAGFANLVPMRSDSRQASVDATICRRSRSAS